MSKWVDNREMADVGACSARPSRSDVRRLIFAAVIKQVIIHSRTSTAAGTRPRSMIVRLGSASVRR
jgi:hypothetical protein